MSELTRKTGNFRYRILALVFMATTIKYFDRSIFDASTSVGAILAPFIVGAIVSVEGANWQIPFLITGLLSSLWVFLWIRTYQKPEMHPLLSKEELAYINSDSEEETKEKIPWLKLLPKRETWAFSLTTITDGAVSYTHLTLPT